MLGKADRRARWQERRVWQLVQAELQAQPVEFPLTSDYGSGSSRVVSHSLDETSSEDQRNDAYARLMATCAGSWEWQEVEARRSHIAPQEPQVLQLQEVPWVQAQFDKTLAQIDALRTHMGSR